MMEIKIYQINLDKDADRIAFESLNRTFKYQHSNKIKSEIYDKVYEGNVEAENLEDIFYIFNCKRPEDYRGRSLSVSDIVEFENRFYFCDSYGFKEVSFDPEKTYELSI